ncbi:solute carrier family 35 member F1 isoform X1 [Castor canadensis]|uniref:Solute carrier family 35 member F1 isoform X1 n=1 Tax=Castor canadensis TaxID=51338 RepID=A0AC58MQW5_CASCN
MREAQMLARSVELFVRPGSRAGWRLCLYLDRAAGQGNTALSEPPFPNRASQTAGRGGGLREARVRAAGKRRQRGGRGRWCWRAKEEIADCLQSRSSRASHNQAVSLHYRKPGKWRSIQPERREMLISVALGQVLSLLVCGIGLTSKYLSEDFHANTPVFQSFLNYILLFLVYTTTLAVRQGEENLLAILRRRWWKYMILGLIDLEANYLMVKAYQYTTLTSVQLLDCFVIPVVILLSWFFLLIRYKAVHFIGIVVCILGMGCMVGADVLVGRHQGAGENKLVGDLLVLGGATLYGISNVWEEYIIRTLSRVEFLGMIGLFGAFFSGIQLAIMEHKELLKVPWDWQIGLLYVGFSACMFGLYSFMPVVIKKTSATSVNLSLLTADLYSLFCGLFLFHYKFSGLYLLSFFTILIGLVLYSSTSTYIAQDPRVYKQFRNPSGPVVDLPTTAQLEPSVTYTSLGQETEEEPHVRVA